MIRYLLPLLALACDPSTQDTGQAHEDLLAVGVWYAVSPSAPLPDDLPHACVPPVCEQAIQLAEDGRVLASQSGLDVWEVGTWQDPGLLVVDGLEAQVVLVDAGHPSYDLEHEAGATRITAWPYMDPPHLRVPGTVDPR